MSAAFRGPILYLRVELEGGRERWYRLAPGSARAGFLLSPLGDYITGEVIVADGGYSSLGPAVALQAALAKAQPPAR